MIMPGSESVMTNSRSVVKQGWLQRIMRRWPLLVGGMMIALGGALWSYEHEVPMYTATTTIVVVPLPQWDETFLGTDLVRDSGDATRTATTLAAELKSRRYANVAARELGGDWTAEKVTEAVTVTTSGETNIIEVVAKAADPDTARRVASGFVDAVTTARWETISSQLESRITALSRGSLASLGDQQGTNSAASVEIARLRTLGFVRDSHIDPTLRVDSSSLPVPDPQMSLPITVIIAALGGLFVGALASAAVDFLRRQRNPLAHESGNGQRPNRSAGSGSVNGRSPVDVK